MNANSNTDRLNNIIRLAATFRDIDAAHRWASSCDKPQRVVMGDHDGTTGVCWVVRPVDAARLERAGYEISIRW